MPGSEYSIDIPVTVYGLDQTDKLQQAIKNTSSQVRITSADFKTWSDAMRVSTDAGYTFNTALNKTSQSLKSAGIDVGAFTDRLRTNVREMDQANSSAGRYEQTLARVGGRLGGIASGIPGGGFMGSQLVGGLSGGAALGVGIGAGVLFGGMELAKQSSELAKYAQEQRNLAKELGTTSAQMYALSAAGEVTGVKLDGIAKATQRLGEELQSGGRRATEIRSALAEIGLSSATAFKDPITALNEIASGLAKIPNEAERARVGIELLGESGRNLSSMARELPSLEERFKVGDETIDRVAKLRDYINEIGQIVKSGALDGLASILSGVMPSTRKPPANPAALSPDKMWGAPIRGPISLSIPGAYGPVGMTSPAEEKASRLDFSRSVATKYGSAEDRFGAQLKGIDADKAKLQQGLFDLTVSRPDYDRQYAGLETKRAGIEAAKRAAEEQQRQREELQQTEARLKSGDIRGDEALKTLSQVPRRFNLLGRSEYQGLSGNLFKMAQPYITSLGREELGKSGESYFDQLGRATGDKYARPYERSLTDRQKAIDEAERTQREFSQSVTAGVSNFSAGIRGTEQYSLAGQRLAGVQASGVSQYGMTQGEIANKSYSDTINGIRAQYGIEASSLRTRASAAQYGANQLQAGDPERDKLLQQAADLSLEARTRETEALTKSAEAANKFNDGVDKAAAALRDSFAGGLESIAMGAQRGAMHGQAGKGTLDALRGYAESQESIFLKNTAGHLFDSGAGGGIGSISKLLHLPAWFTAGSALSPLDAKKNPGLDANTSSTEKNTSATDRLTGALAQIYGHPTSGGMSLAGVTYDASGNPVATTVPTSSPVGSIAGDITSVGSVALGVAGAAGSTTASTDVSAALKASVSIANDMKAITSGTTAPYAFSTLFGSGSASSKIGAGASIAGAGLGAYEGISNIVQGGSKNVSGGIGELLGAGALLGGPAAPFLAAGGAIAGLVSAFLPDQQTERANQISKNIFDDQYLAPPSQSLTVGANGGYSDVNFQGGVRTSNLSPYPVVSDPYLDVPRRTDVPGHTIGSFGGYSGTPGAVVTPQPPRNITINAMDSQSFGDFLKRNPAGLVDGVHSALNSGHATEMIHTMGQQLGLR